MLGVDVGGGCLINPLPTKHQIDPLLFFPKPKESFYSLLSLSTLLFSSKMSASNMSTSEKLSTITGLTIESIKRICDNKGTEEDLMLFNNFTETSIYKKDLLSASKVVALANATLRLAQKIEATSVDDEEPVLEQYFTLNNMIPVAGNLLMC